MKYLMSLNLFTLSLLLSLSPAVAQSYEVDTTSSQVKFIAKGKPGFLKIEGEGAQLSGVVTRTEKGWSGQVNASLVNVKTGIDLRDEHMHDKYLETSKFPTAALAIEGVTINSGDSDGSFVGKLTIKGVSHPIVGICEVKSLSATELIGGIAFEFDLANYPVGVPSYLGVTVASTVKVAAEFKAQSNHTH